MLYWYSTRTSARFDAVAALGPLTNTCVWLGLLDALPIVPMDGGRVLSALLDVAAHNTGYTLSVTVAVRLVVAIVGPYL